MRSEEEIKNKLKELKDTEKYRHMTFGAFIARYLTDSFNEKALEWVLGLRDDL